MARITIEDALKEGKNRFALCLLAIQRAKQLLKGSQPVSAKKTNREIVTALREIAESKVKYAHPEYLIGRPAPIKAIEDKEEETGELQNIE